MKESGSGWPNRLINLIVNSASPSSAARIPKIIRPAASFLVTAGCAKQLSACGYCRIRYDKKYEFDFGDFWLSETTGSASGESLPFRKRVESSAGSAVFFSQHT
jgi:hypothetical protein